MTPLDRIKAPINEQIVKYDKRVKSWLSSDSGAISNILKYILSTRGKGIRPLLVMLTHSLHTTKEQRDLSSERCFIGAMLIEMMHTASLLHDDVVDEAYIRRGKPSANALWRSHNAILAGDYILAKSYSVGLKRGEYDIVQYITQAMEELCDGELIQSSQSEKLKMTREIYLDIIYKKTATLIGASSATGAIAAGATKESVELMKSFGDNLGMAFQIKDDILDFEPTKKTGKPTCVDIRERKITLPLLTVLEESTPAEHKKIISLLSNIRNKPANTEHIIDYVINGKGIEKSYVVMQQYITTAKSQLDAYDDSEIKRALLSLCDFIADRDK